MRTKIIHGSVTEVLPGLPRPRMIFADPPDNLGLEYPGFVDKALNYTSKFHTWLLACLDAAPVVWFTPYYRYIGQVVTMLERRPALDWRMVPWRFTFGQHRLYDLGNGFRPVFRISTPGYEWQTDAIRVRSARQELGDKRADPRGRVPDDVWEFSRVCGTFHERRAWFPTQIPEALVERSIRMTIPEADFSTALVIDPFLGSGTTLRVCQRLHIACIGIDVSEETCVKVSEENAVPWSHWS